MKRGIIANGEFMLAPNRLAVEALPTGYTLDTYLGSLGFKEVRTETLTERSRYYDYSVQYSDEGEYIREYTVGTLYEGEALAKERKEEIIERVRLVYDIDDELAILHDQSTKPDEYAAYQAFRETTKAEIDEEIATLQNNLAR